MQFKATLVSLFIAGALAAPSSAKVPEGAVLKQSTTNNIWTVQDFKRECNEEDTKCTATFYLNTTGPSSTDCSYDVEGSPASQSNGPPEGGQCGDFTVHSGYDSTGWTQYTVAHYESGLIIYPAYKDEQLEGGEVVKPDVAEYPQPLP